MGKGRECQSFCGLLSSMWQFHFKKNRSWRPHELAMPSALVWARPCSCTARRLQDTSSPLMQQDEDTQRHSFGQTLSARSPPSFAHPPAFALQATSVRECEQEESRAERSAKGLLSSPPSRSHCRRLCHLPPPPRKIDQLFLQQLLPASRRDLCSSNIFFVNSLTYASSRSPSASTNLG